MEGVRVEEAMRGRLKRARRDMVVVSVCAR